MIWGEPSRAVNFTPMPAHSPVGPRRYATLLDAAYGALKSVSKKNLVIGAMTWTLGDVYPLEFLKWMRLPNGKLPRMDMWGHNPFATRFPQLSKKPYYPGLIDISDVDTLHAAIAKVYKPSGGPGRRTPKLWLSEWTVMSSRPDHAFDFFVSKAQQAKWITAAYKLANQAPYVVGLGWFALLDESLTVKQSMTQGLMDSRGKAKPAFDAYRRAR